MFIFLYFGLFEIYVYYTCQHLFKFIVVNKNFILIPFICTYIWVVLLGIIIWKLKRIKLKVFNLNYFFLVWRKRNMRLYILFCFLKNNNISFIIFICLIIIMKVNTIQIGVDNLKHKRKTLSILLFFWNFLFILSSFCVKW